MKDVNKVILIGRLGADPLLRATQSGVSVVSFPLATSRRVHRSDSAESERGQVMEETTWHRIVVWGKQGEFCAHSLRKGSPVYLEGSMRTRSYEDKNQVIRTLVEIHVEEISLLRTEKQNPPKISSESFDEVQISDFKVS